MSGTWIGSDLPPIWRDGEEYFLIGRDDSLYLVLNRCPHRGGPLKSGYINDADEIVCPMHKGAFAVESLLNRPSTIRLQDGGREP